MRSRRWPLRRAYALAIVAIVTLIISLAYFSIAQEKIRYRERAAIATQNIAHLLDQNVSNAFDKVDGVLQSIAFDYLDRKAQGPLDPAKLNAYLAHHERLNPEVLSFRIVDQEGILRFGTSLLSDSVVNRSDRDFFTRARDEPTAGLIISGPIFGRISKQWVLVLARRLIAPDGSFAGIVYANIPTTYFEKVFSSVALGSGGAATIRTTDLALVHRTPETKNAVGSKEVSPQLRDLMLAHSQGGQYIAITALDGIERSNAYRRLERYPFYIIVGIATDDFLGGWKNNVLTLSGLAGLAMLVTCLAGLVVYRCARQLSIERSHLRTLLTTLPDLVWLKSPEGVYRACNPAFERLFGACEADIVGKTDNDLVSSVLAEHFRQKDHEALAAENLLVYEQWVPHAGEGRQVLLETTKTTMRGSDGRLLGVLGIAHDITERHQMAEQVRQLAYHDPLTKLPNRRLLNDRLHQTIAASKRSACYGALIFLDLDNFKPLNDAHGHEVGDLLLIEAADRLKHCLREMDTVARFGGDEFVVMLPELDRDVAESTAQAGLVAEKIRRALSEPYRLTMESEEKRTIQHQCTASIGVALFRHHEGRVDEVVRWADAAMYEAKEAGRNLIRFHSLS